MKYKLNKYFLGILAISLLLSGCNKNEDQLATIISNKQNILTFMNSDEFYSTVNKVNKMNFEERNAWEKTKGFNSFGTICDEKMQKVNPEQFKSIEELKTFVASNSEYIQLYTNPNGDIYYVTQDFKNPERYMMNNDKMYIIGTTVFKQFNDVIVTTDIANEEALRLAKNINSLSSNPIFKVRNSMSKIPIQKAKDAYEHYFDRYNDNGIYRLHVYFDTFNYTELTEEGWPKYRMTYFKIMNFVKGFLGIWYGKTLTTTFYYKIESYDDWSGLWQTNGSGTSGTNQPVMTYYDRFVNIKAISDGGPYIYTWDVSVSNTMGCKLGNLDFY